MLGTLALLLGAAACLQAGNKPVDYPHNDGGAWDSPRPWKKNKRRNKRRSGWF